MFDFYMRLPHTCTIHADTVMWVGSSLKLTLYCCCMDVHTNAYVSNRLTYVHKFRTAAITVYIQLCIFYHAEL